MLLLVRKKLVSADCACAGALARADMAATAKHAGKMIRARLFIEVLPVCFYGSFVINPPWQALFPCRMKNIAPRSEQADHAEDKQHDKEKGAAERTAAPCLSRCGDQLVCWIAESSQSAPRRRAKVHTSVASIGVSLPETRRPVVRSRVLSTSENRIATLAKSVSPSRQASARSPCSSLTSVTLLTSLFALFSSRSLEKYETISGVANVCSLATSSFDHAA